MGIIWHAFGNERKAGQRISRLLRLNINQTTMVHLLAYQPTRIRSMSSVFEQCSYLNAYLNLLNNT